MAVKNTAQVVIGGKIFTLGGYESEEYFQKVASYINNKMDRETIVSCLRNRLEQIYQNADK